MYVATPEQRCGDEERKRWELLAPEQNHYSTMTMNNTSEVYAVGLEAIRCSQKRQ